ncbi:hypothetical protein GCM10010302_23750 [Streptomyces polychromogenes]|uniref:Uncharacterized protein n=1 Tax=Streptomyces polychromogenes TaxID=67342 RepID=A0ABP3F0M3_9ACTN
MPPAYPGAHTVRIMRTPERRPGREIRETPSEAIVNTPATGLGGPPGGRVSRGAGEAAGGGAKGAHTVVRRIREWALTWGYVAELDTMSP